MGHRAQALAEAVSVFPLKAYALAAIAVALVIPAGLFTDAWWALFLAMIGVALGATSAVMLIHDKRRDNFAKPTEEGLAQKEGGAARDRSSSRPGTRRV